MFPRPTVRQILNKYPNISRLFTPPAQPPYDPLDLTTPTNSPLAGLHAACHTSDELLRTGLLLRRFYFMTYVPSGFWPRLISRFLTCTAFVSIVLRALGYTEDMIAVTMGQVAKGESSKALGLEWAYWKTGIELWYKGLSLLRVTEIIPEGIFNNCEPSPSIFEQSRTIPIDPTEAVQDLSFELNGQWMPVHMTPNHGIEILIPDAVCPAVMRSDVDSGQGEGGRSEYTRERVWMSAGLLTQAVDFIDTLLEDWYPGLGAREGTVSVDSIPYVNRVIPCPFCVSGACVSDPLDERTGREATPPSPPESRSREQSPLLTSGSTPPMPLSVPCDPHAHSELECDSTRRHRQRAVNISPHLPPRLARRPLFPDQRKSPSHSAPSDTAMFLSPQTRRRNIEWRGRSLSSPLSHPQTPDEAPMISDPGQYTMSGYPA